MTDQTTITSQRTESTERAWQAIDLEKKRDALIRRVGVLGWGAAVICLVLLGVIFGWKTIIFVKYALTGVYGWLRVLEVLMPLVVIVGVFGILVGILATALAFLRLRTASLSEIQLRLAALEDLLLAGKADEH